MMLAAINYLTELNRREHGSMDVPLSMKQKEWEHKEVGLLETVADLTHHRINPMQIKLERLQMENQYLREVSYDNNIR
jgi:hypothetical protein